MPGFGPFLGASLLFGANDLRDFQRRASRCRRRTRARPQRLRPATPATCTDHRRYSRSLRHVFYLSLQTSTMRAGPNRDYYLKKRARGATHNQAVIAPARRRIDVLWALLRENRTWTATLRIRSRPGRLTTPLRFPMPGLGSGHHTGNGRRGW